MAPLAGKRSKSMPCTNIDKTRVADGCGYRVWRVAVESTQMVHVLIIEPHVELATAFEKAIACASYAPLVRRHVDSLDDLDVRPDTIVMRIGHADVSNLPPHRPPIVAIAATDEDVAEASRLRCEVVLHGPAEIKRLCEAVRTVTQRRL